jgi:preprotein translocase subunit SecG
VLFPDILFAQGSSWIGALMNAGLIILSLFMILLVLIQRGKGGGLAGAFGGAGGSSAFGSRAGDTFTRITIIVAAIWILLIMIMVKVVHPPAPPPEGRGAEAVESSSGEPET